MTSRISRIYRGSSVNNDIYPGQENKDKNKERKPERKRDSLDEAFFLEPVNKSTDGGVDILA